MSTLFDGDTIDGREATVRIINDRTPNDTSSITAEDEEEYGCEIEDCNGYAVNVTWDNGETTVECSTAISYDGDGIAHIR